MSELVLRPREDFNIWQVAGGDEHRTYADELVRHNVALIGPGGPGPWSHKRRHATYEGRYVERFAREGADDLRRGDVVVLRTGRSTMRAVGIVQSPYQFYEAFDDLNGWDVQHGRRVLWWRLPTPVRFDSLVFPMVRFSGVNKTVVRKAAMASLERRARFPTTLAPIPPPEKQLDERELSPQLRACLETLRSWSRFYQNPARSGEDWPTEHETVANCVMPFFRALGWRKEEIAVEWKRYDVALVSPSARARENVHIIVEAKRIEDGIEGARLQVEERGYLHQFEKPPIVVVTDGFRYKAYAPTSGRCLAYANANKPRVSAQALFQLLSRVETLRRNHNGPMV